jgi:hypothetical protein
MSGKTLLMFCWRPDPCSLALCLCSEAADFLLKIGKGFKGVCFFDTASRGWVIKDVQGRVTPRHSSPIAVSEV